MAEPLDTALPPMTVDKTQPGDNYIWRAIDKKLNVLYIYGRPDLLNARRLAHEQVRKGWLVENPIPKEQRRWKV
jgi:hypothetical protein